MRSEPRVDRFTLVAALVFVPVVSGILVRRAIFHLYGTGDFIPSGTGTEVLRWWEGPTGGHLVAGVLAAGIAYARTGRAGSALLLGVAAAALFWLYPAVAFFAWLALGGDPGWR